METQGERLGLIENARAWLCTLPVENVRTDAVQEFTKQETIFVEINTATGVQGIGYSYTIGTGGAAVLSLLRSVLLDVLIGLDADRPEAVWRMLCSATRATMVGPVTSLALAAVDTAVWDARCKASGQPLWIAAGGARSQVPLYDTEGGWLHLSTEELVERALNARETGWPGIKVKVGKPRASDDAKRLGAVRDAVGDGMDVMIDANQSLTRAEAVRRAAAFADFDIFWFEEPLPADDVTGHQRLAQTTTIPVAVGESIYSVSKFREFLQVGAAEIVQVDVARIGGITPWLKVAHLAEAYNVDVAPHFLMELHVSLACAVPNALYVEHIPQLRAVTDDEIAVVEGHAFPPSNPGLGISWDRKAVDRLRVA
nr:mandelate racemase/muconate lactonizing enzyme family protein [Phytoactinopolyspora endophytica]